MKLLVVANLTVDSDELYNALHEQAEHGPLCVTLLVPQDPRHDLGPRVQAALNRLREAGIDAEAIAGDSDPACAVIEVWDPRRWDRVIVSTLPTGTSRWMHIDLPHRIHKAIDAPVSRVISRPTREPLTA